MVTVFQPIPGAVASRLLFVTRKRTQGSHMKKTIALVVLATGVIAASAGAGVTALRGTITADGSSTVGPYAIAAAEGFQKRNPAARVTVGISGTGGGFERFCRNETDLSNASRGMKNSEAILCRDAGVKWLAFTVANDGISIVVNKANTWVDCLTTAELKTIWNTGSKIDNWKDIRSSFPDVPLKLFGPGTDSGTFDFFTEKINGKAKASRSDYLATEDDNVIVNGVEGERGGMGYFGFSYYEENATKLKLVKVDSGTGCIAPSVRTVQNTTYRPLSRPLFIYAKRSSFKRPVVAGFFGYIFNNEKAIARKAGFISLTDRQLRKARYTYLQALKSNNT
jgi:phosphate transport system substrate-binding protein